MHLIRKISLSSFRLRNAYEEFERMHYCLLNREEKEYRRKLAESDYFDPGYYRRQLPQNLVARFMPFRHFILRGERMKVSPSPDFESRQYFQQNPDVSKLGMPALRHFLLFGQAEGRRTAHSRVTVSDSSPPPSPISQEEPVTYAHIGAGKCGSSAIQSCLSHSPVLTRKEGGEMDYRVITQVGVLRGNEVRKHLQHLSNGYYPSMPATKVAQLSDKVFSNAVSAVSKARTPVVFSFESWLNEMANKPELRSRMMELFSGGDTRKVKLIAFVRPLPKWINSAWWQWGAWTPGVQFNDWLETAIKVDWNLVSRRLIKAVGDDVLTVRPVLGNVVDQFFDEIGCVKPDDQADSANKSLPAAVLNLYHHALDLRPGPHDMKSDFIAGRILSPSRRSYTPTPWVLGPRQIETILRRTKKSNLKLIELMSPSDREAVLADPSWWSVDAYQGYEKVNANIAPKTAPGDMIALSADLFRGLNASVGLLSKHGLLRELDAELTNHFPIQEIKKKAAPSS